MTVDATRRPSLPTLNVRRLPKLPAAATTRQVSVDSVPRGWHEWTVADFVYGTRKDAVKRPMMTYAGPDGTWDFRSAGSSFRDAVAAGRDAAKTGDGYAQGVFQARNGTYYLATLGWYQPDDEVVEPMPLDSTWAPLDVDAVHQRLRDLKAVVGTRKWVDFS